MLSHCLQERGRWPEQLVQDVLEGGRGGGGRRGEGGEVKRGRKSERDMRKEKTIILISIPFLFVGWSVWIEVLCQRW